MGFLGFFKALFGICATKPLADELWSMEDGKAKLKLADAPQLAQNGGGIYIQGKGLEKPILIIKSDGGDILAFTNSCTHGGRKIDPVAGEAKLRCCSVGHSTFDYDGNVLSGGAKGPLTKHEVVVDEDSNVVITI
jgi:Rieske Fe-S protein